MQVTIDRILEFAPKCPPAWGHALIDAMDIEGIASPSSHRATMFLASCAHETAGFTKFVENLNYSATRLRAVFPRHFPTMTVAMDYAGDPERIANRAYANRYGNGNEASGDGWRFRGRGPMHLTFRSNYQHAGRVLRLPLQFLPEEVAEPIVGSRVAAWFWRNAGCNSVADDDDYLAVCGRINGTPPRGMDSRHRWLELARLVFLPE